MGTGDDSQVALVPHRWHAVLENFCSCPISAVAHRSGRSWWASVIQTKQVRQLDGRRHEQPTRRSRQSCQVRTARRQFGTDSRQVWTRTRTAGVRSRERKFVKKEHSYTCAAQIAHLSWHEVRGSRGHLREVKGVITDLINQVQVEVSPDAHHTSCYVERKLHEENMQKNMLSSAASPRGQGAGCTRPVRRQG